MYWAMVLWWCRTYVSAYFRPSAAIAASKGRHSHRPSVSRYSCIPAKRWSALWWNTLRVQTIQRVLTQVYDANKRVTFMAAL